jgi:hypothetical protein
MSCKIHLFVSELLVLVVLAACGPTATIELTPIPPTPVAPTATIEPTPLPPTLVIPTINPPTPVLPTASPTSTPTPLPPTPTTSLPPTPAALPKGPGALWHLVVIGDSSSWGLGEAYANQIEKDMGVKVLLEDYALPDFTAREVLRLLRSPQYQEYETEGLTDAIKEAEVLVVSPSPMKSVDPGTAHSIDNCFAASAPAPCTPQAFQDYTADLEAIWAKIFELRAGQPTILRTVDSASPFVGAWIKAQVFNECTVCWQCVSDAMHLAANAYHIPFVSRYDAFNGLNHNEDPIQKGYVRSDNIHPNALASQLTAELLSKLGYEPVPPPEK